MYPDGGMRKNRGFALPAAIFVLVVVAAIVASMVRLGATQINQVNMSLLTSRAYWAAQSGLEWATHQVSATNACFGNTTLTIGSFAVQMQCTADAYQEAGFTSVVRYHVSAVATTQNAAIDDPDYVYRSAQVELLVKVSS